MHAERLLQCCAPAQTIFQRRFVDLAQIGQSVLIQHVGHGRSQASQLGQRTAWHSDCACIDLAVRAERVWLVALESLVDALLEHQCQLGPLQLEAEGRHHVAVGASGIRQLLQHSPAAEQMNKHT